MTNLTPYEQGRIDGLTHLPDFMVSESDKQARETYYNSLTSEEQKDYERGWEDGYGYVPPQEKAPSPLLRPQKRGTARQQ